MVLRSSPDHPLELQFCYSRTDNERGVFMEFERCKDIMLRESALVQEIGKLQDMVYNSVVCRDWTDFDVQFDALGEMGRDLAMLEAERERVFSESMSGDAVGLTADASSRFYAFAARLPIKQRKEITEIYRNLKMETIKVHSAGETLMGYITGARATMSGFFDAAFPDKAGKTYSPYGTQVSNDRRSMVLNQRY